MIRSLSFRLALIYVGLFASSVALLMSSYYWVSVWRPLVDAREEVRREMGILATLYIVDGRTALLDRLELRAARRDSRKAFHAFLAPDGSVLSANVPSWPRTPSSGWIHIEADLYFDGDEEDHHALALDRPFDDGARLLVGRDIEDIDEREEALAAAAAWIGGIAVALGVLGGALMSIAIGRRIEAVNATARRVIGGDLSERVAIRGSGDDFDQLGETLNLMLARIEELVDSVRRVSDSVAHELRTPLARLQADLEDLAQSDIGDAERLRLTGQALAEAERLQSIFDALLRIARIQAGSHGTGMRDLDLAVLLNDAVELYQPQAEAKAIDLRIDVTGDMSARGDPDLLFQAMSNLLDNAIKFTPEGGGVTLSASAAGDRLLIAISDTGPGIAPEHRGRVAERFFRAPGAEGHPGSGLGLSLVAAVAALHDADFAFGDRDAGASAVWSMPNREGRRGSGDDTALA